MLSYILELSKVVCLDRCGASITKTTRGKNIYMRGISRPRFLASLVVTSGG